jgi:hypothetical protein
VFGLVFWIFSRHLGARHLSGPNFGEAKCELESTNYPNSRPTRQLARVRSFLANLFGTLRAEENLEEALIT